MFDPKESGRLLKTDWSSPRELARELYEFFTSRSSRRVEAPVEIAVPPGETALRLTRSGAAPSRSSLASPRPPAPAPAPVAAEEPPRTVVRFSAASAVKRAGPIGKALASILEPPEGTPPPEPERPRSEPPAPPPRTSLSRDDPRSDRVDLPPTPAPEKVQIGPSAQGKATIGEARVVPVSFARKYDAPVFEVADAFRAEPGRPVQFDQAPLVRNEQSGEYEEFDYAAKLTNIPRQHMVKFYFGEVVSKLEKDENYRQRYLVDLYTYPGDAKSATETVTIFRMDPNDSLPPTYPLFPIWQFMGNSQYYAQPPLFY